MAAKLAGDRGDAIRQQMPALQEWAFVTRTVLFDRAIAGRIDAGVRTVANLGTGLDTRPYRMELPAELRWIEVDHPDLLAYKTQILAAEQPRCRLERVWLNLADRAARRQLLAGLAGALAITEGVIVYLEESEVAELAGDLAAAGVASWVLDLCSPALLKMLQATSGRVLAAAGMPLKFAPADGVEFFQPFGWKPLALDSVFETAAKLGRIPQELLSAPPPPPGPDGPIWSGTVLLERSGK